AMIDPADPTRRALVLTDAEGAPIAAMEVTDATLVEAADPSVDRGVLVGGPVTAYGDGGHGVFRRLRYRPDQVRAMLGQGRVLGVIVDRPLHRPQLAQIVHAARTIGSKVLLLVPVAGPGPEGLPPESLVRAVLAAAERVPNVHVVAVPIASHHDDV